MTSKPTTPLRPGDREPVSYSELASHRESERPVPAGSEIPRLPESSPWSSPESWGALEPPLGDLGLDCSDTVGQALGGAPPTKDEPEKANSDE